MSDTFLTNKKLQCEEFGCIVRTKAYCLRLSTLARMTCDSYFFLLLEILVRMCRFEEQKPQILCQLLKLSSGAGDLTKTTTM